MTERCAECRFWDSYESSPSVGVCRRYSPRPSMVSLLHAAPHPNQNVVWPEVFNTSWCGEFEQK